MTIEPNITEDLVQELIAEQFPEYAHLSIKSVKHQGHDNRTFHLGDKMLVRLPSGEEYVRQIAKEHKWLTLLAVKLPLPIPEPIAMGNPSNDYPFNWSIYRWLEGNSANTVELNDIALETIAIQLSLFLQSLHKFDADIDSAPEVHNWWRAAHTSTYDKETRELINNLKHVIDAEKANSLWQKAISSKWEKKPVWVHGDVASGNILLKEGKLSAVIDFGCMGIGDPACDLTIAWTFFKNNSRQVFKNAFNFDTETWNRARGWALWKAMFTVNEIEDKASLDATKQLQIINEVINEYKFSK